MTPSFGDIVFNPGKNCIKDLFLRSDIEFITRYDVNKLVHRQKEKLFTFCYLILISEVDLCGLECF